MKTSIIKPNAALFNKQYQDIKPITNNLIPNELLSKSEPAAEKIKKPGIVMSMVLKAQKWAISLEIKSLEDLIMQQKIGIGVAVRCEKKGLPCPDSIIDLQRELSQSYDELSRLSNKLRDIDLQLDCK